MYNKIPSLSRVFGNKRCQGYMSKFCNLFGSLGDYYNTIIITRTTPIVTAVGHYPRPVLHYHYGKIASLPMQMFRIHLE